MSASPTAIPFGIDLSSTFGAMFWGVLVSIGLFGITIGQMWAYINDNHDGWGLRSYVAVLFALDLATTILNGEFANSYFIVNFGNLEALTVINKSILIEFALTIVAIFMVQLFFASRVYLINKDAKLSAIFIVFTAVAGLGTGIYTITEAFKGRLISIVATRTIRISIGVEQLFILLSDATATFALSWSLAKAQKESQIKKTVTMLQRILGFVVARGLSVTIVTLVYAIMYIVHPASLYWLPLHLMLSKLYVITMIAMLNSRNWFQNYAEGMVTITATDTSMIFQNNNSTTVANSGVNTTSGQHGAFELKSFSSRSHTFDGHDSAKNDEVFISREVNVV